MLQRKSSSALTAAEQQTYINVITQLNSGPAPSTYAQFVAIHADMGHNVHGMPGMSTGYQRFLPWHRDFLWQLETAMRQIDAASFIPYWDWTVDRDVPQWLAGFLPVVVVPPTAATPQQTVQVVREPQVPAVMPTPQQIAGVLNNQRLNYTRFTRTIEHFHDTVHMWVGGTMSDITVSPADPLFWMNHAQVDRLWSQWQALPANVGKSPVITGVDAVLDPWNPDTINTVASISAMGYEYS